MAFDLKPELLQISLVIGPGRVATGWMVYPGFPPLMHEFTEMKPILKPSGEHYTLQDFCLLLAFERLPPLYAAMSGHERLAVHAAEEEARNALRAVGAVNETVPDGST